MSAYGIRKMEAAANKAQVTRWWSRLEAKCKELKREDLIDKFKPDLTGSWRKIDKACLKLENEIAKIIPGFISMDE